MIVFQNTSLAFNRDFLATIFTRTTCSFTSCYSCRSFSCWGWWVSCLGCLGCWGCLGCLGLGCLGCLSCWGCLSCQGCRSSWWCWTSYWRINVSTSASLANSNNWLRAVVNLKEPFSTTNLKRKY